MTAWNFWLVDILNLACLRTGALPVGRNHIIAAKHAFIKNKMCDELNTFIMSSAQTGAASSIACTGQRPAQRLCHARKDIVPGKILINYNLQTGQLVF